MLQDTIRYGCRSPFTVHRSRRSEVVCATRPIRNTSGSGRRRQSSGVARSAGGLSHNPALPRARVTGPGGPSRAKVETNRSIPCARRSPGAHGIGTAHPEMMKFLRESSTDETGEGRELERQIAELLDRIVQRLMDEATSTSGCPPGARGIHPAPRAGGPGRSAARDVQFNLTEKGMDFLGYKTLKNLWAASARPSGGARDAAPRDRRGDRGRQQGIRVRRRDEPGCGGDPVQCHCARGLAMPLNLEYADLRVHQSEYRSSGNRADARCSHSMILYGRSLYPGQEGGARAHAPDPDPSWGLASGVLFHDSAEEIPLGALPGAQVGPYHTNTAEGLKLARRILTGQRSDEAGDHDHRREALGAHPAEWSGVHSSGTRSPDPAATYREVGHCRRSGS